MPIRPTLAEMATAPPDFRTAFCTMARCPDLAFERAVFWHSLHRHAVPLAWLLRWLRPAFFREDDQLIQQVGRDRSLEEVAEDIEHFQYGNRVHSHWLRTGLRMHIAPQRLAALARRCLAG